MEKNGEDEERNGFKLRWYIIIGIILTVFFEAFFNKLRIDSRRFFEYIHWALGVGILGVVCKLFKNTDKKAEKMNKVYKNIMRKLGKGYRAPDLSLHIAYCVLQKIIKFIYPLFSNGLKGRMVMLMLLLTPMFGILNPVKIANELGKEVSNLINEVYELKEEKNNKADFKMNMEYSQSNEFDKN